MAQATAQPQQQQPQPPQVPGNQPPPPPSAGIQDQATLKNRQSAHPALRGREQQPPVQGQPPVQQPAPVPGQQPVYQQPAPVPGQQPVYQQPAPVPGQPPQTIDGTPLAPGQQSPYFPGQQPVQQPYQPIYNPAQNQSPQFFQNQGPVMPGMFVANQPATEQQPTEVDQAQNSALDTVMQELKTLKEAQIEASEKQQLESLMQTPSFDNLTSIESDQASEVYERLMKPQLEKVINHFQNSRQSLMDKLNTSIQSLSSQKETKQPTNGTDLKGITNSSILASIPSFQSDMQDPNFLAIANQPIPGTNTTYFSEISKAYHSNDPAYVINTANWIKSQIYQHMPQQALEPMAQSPGAMMQPTAPPATEGQFFYDDLRIKQEQLQKGEITRKDFLDFKIQFDSAKANNMVTERPKAA